MSSKSDVATKGKQQLRVKEDETNTRKRKKETSNCQVAKRRSRQEAKMQGQAISNIEHGISAFSKIETRQQRNQRVLQEKQSNEVAKMDLSGKTSSFTFTNYFVPVTRTVSPLPELGWADPKEVWSVMLEKDRMYTKDPLMLRKHPQLLPRMRAVLLDWIIEVCEVYRLHRETYCLALDFIDRYLSRSTNVQKQRLQLIGVTALFIAAKIEEVYPPKLSEFAYVTDGACTEDEILTQELVMLKVLEWSLSPVTSNTWLNIYMQIHNYTTRRDNLKNKENFVIPKYSQQGFVQVSYLLDLCSLDVGCLQFSCSMMAASALYHMLPVEIEDITGHTWEELFPCIQWMRSFSATVREQGTVKLRKFDKIASEDAHNIQTHLVDLTQIERAQLRQKDYCQVPSERVSPNPSLPFVPLTPPSSAKKSSCYD